ncbi:PREDICTED: (-)-germacrene D synthase-like [Fragaria vesca subsp. vesca]|uniref:(-)-germacrene D synthase-like n=1 Tax=Fragaria vesca subsp. vesca TaxID=101020 RepID=UPI0002C2F6C2|nr:PREDICTED: (-)-germacrene D synthase-like [Fragaria vesca subsp. vesca]
MAPAQSQIANAASDVKRCSPHYTPGIEAEAYSAAAHLEADAVQEQHFQELKEQVRRMLMAAVYQPSNILDMIDNIQRLGLSNNFENEINAILKLVHNGYGTEDLENDGDLYTIALRFRLLRQQGYNVSCDVFNRFKQSNGTFKESLTSDVVGLLSLYEATHLRVHGEDILEEALTFTTSHLKSAAPRLSSILSKQVTHALYQPLWKGFSRLEARHYMSVYEEDGSYNQTLLTLAKLNFNLVQKVHQKELSDMTRWWKDLDFVNKLPFARDRLVEAYFWGLATCYEPEYYFARIMACKYGALTTVLDDVYDAYGTYEELERFTEAIERWDIFVVDQLQLPQCMEVCYKGLLDSYSGYEEKLADEGNLYRIEFAKEAIKIQLRGYFQEAKWLKEKYTPTMDEYIPNALDTSFYPMAITTSVGMGGLVIKDTMDWVLNHPKIVKATTLIGRLLNDMAGHKFEQTNEQCASSVECYMNHYGVGEEEAKIALTKQKDAAWKDLNQELLDLHSSNSIPKPLLQIILNLARSSEVIYKNMEGFNNSSALKGFIDSLLIEPVHV